jgi:hypothetical protein
LRAYPAVLREFAIIQSRASKFWNALISATESEHFSVYINAPAQERAVNGFLRTYATPLSFITGLAVSVTGLMMLFGVRGEIGDLHEWIGIAFVAALLLHMVRNWRGVGAMLKTKTSMAIVGVLGVAFAVLIAFTFLPSGEGQGRGPHGPWMVVNRVAEVPIATAAPALGLSSEQAVSKLRSGGVPVDGPQESLANISRDHNQPLPRLFGILLNES